MQGIATLGKKKNHLNFLLNVSYHPQKKNICQKVRVHVDGKSPDSERLQPPQGARLTAHSTAFIMSHPAAETGQRHILVSSGIKLTG